MLRSLIAFIVALTIAITGIVQPAYAASDNTYNFSNQGNGNSIYLNDSLQNSNPGVANTILQPFIDGAVAAVGTIVGTAVVCYVAIPAVTTVFPPAAALVPFCPAIGTSIGGAEAAVKFVAQH